jgi:hypothetical protein
VTNLAELGRRLRAPLIVFVLASCVYCAVSWERLLTPSPDNHYSHLAQGFLEGRLGLEGDPPGMNDWACFDTVARGPCPPSRFHFPEDHDGRYRWFVSYPAAPAVVLMPVVAFGGVAIRDRLIWAVLAGLAPALLYVLLRFLRERGVSGRSIRDDALVTVLFAVGSVYFFSAVQGSVWFAAHVVACALLFPFVLFAFEARRPVLAGLTLGLAFHARPTAVLLGVFFLLEAIRAFRRDDVPEVDSVAPFAPRLVRYLRGTRGLDVARACGLFAVPLAIAGGVAMWMNHVRFGNVFEFGHQYLQIYWRDRIERWGLFNFHYVGRNLAVMLAALPWLSAVAPYVKIGRHGLALWVTTPNLWTAVWPKHTGRLTASLWLAVLPVLLVNLMYQNSGWIQFGYRFALDWLPLVFVAIAISGRRFGLGFVALVVCSIRW